MTGAELVNEILLEAAAFINKVCPGPDTGIAAKEPFCIRAHPEKTKFFSLKGAALFSDAGLPIPGPAGPSSSTSVSAAIPFKIVDATKCLGSFLGPDAFVENECVKLVDSWESRALAISSLATDLPREALLLLRSCHCTRITHLLRTTPPRLVEKAAKRFDDITKAAFLAIVRRPALTDKQWGRVFAPPVLGGLGLLSATRTSTDAYAGSLGLCLSLLSDLETTVWPEEFRGAVADFEIRECPTQEDFHNALAAAEIGFKRSVRRLKDLQTRLGKLSENDTTEWKQPLEKFPTSDELRAKPFPALQRLLSKRRTALDLLQATDLPASGATTAQKEEAARILSSSGAGAMAWALALPKHFLPFRPKNFVGALTQWLGLRTPEEEANAGVLCVCGSAACPPSGPAHVGFCSRAAGTFRTHKHNRVQEEIFALCKEAGLRPSKEDRAQPAEAAVEDGVDRSRTDVLIPDMLIDAKGPDNRPTTVRKTVALDVAVVEPGCATGIAKGSFRVRGGYGTSYATNVKEKHYVGLVGADTLFLPAVVETNGFMDHRFRRFFRLLAEHVTNTAQLGSDVSGEDMVILRSVKMSQYYARISTVLQIAVTDCIFKSAHRLGFKLARKDPAKHRLSDAHKLKADAHPLIGNSLRSRNAIFID